MTALEIEVSQTTAEPRELPAHLTRFVGREREIAALVPLLETTRLLTLTGAGGSGKTRLASELAGRTASRFDAVAWVDFASLSDPSLVTQQVVDALSLPQRVGTAASDVLLAEISGREFLLVLDNCEHLVDACAALAEALLRNCPQLTILATSRQALGIGGEASWLVPPMQADEAAQLFVERAQSVQSAFRLTEANAGVLADICRRLDGLPLAIELAAARVRVLSPEQIAERLHDAFRLLTVGSRTALPRHRTLRSVIDWSYSLLNPREQILLARLAVFVRSFSLEAAEAVCAGAELQDEDILDGVSALVEKSLVVMDAGEGTARYHLLETVRQYGLERLADAGEDAQVRERHAQFFVALAERTYPRFIGGEHEPGLTSRMKEDNDNLRAACAWSLAHAGRSEYALRLAGSLFWYWYCTGQFHEGSRFVDAALPGPASSSARNLGAALGARGFLALAQGRLAESCDALARAIDLQREAGDEEGATISLIKLAAAHLHQGNRDIAARLLDEAALVTPRFKPIVQIFLNFWRGWAALETGDTRAARALFEQNWDIGRIAEHRTAIAHSTTLLGYVALGEARTEEASTHFLDALQQHSLLSDVWGLALDIDGMAAVAVARGDVLRGLTLLAGAEALRQRMGMAVPGVTLAQHTRVVQQVRDALGADFDRLFAECLQRPLNDVLRKARGEDITGTFAVVQLPAVTPAAEPEYEAGTARLAVEALGPLVVTIDGKAVDPASWGSARSRELLVYLLTHPGGVTKEQVGLAFWPDASTAQLRNNFHVTLHRLRKTLGDPAWVTLTGERYAIDAGIVERFDVADFEREIKAARRSLKRREENAVAELERALAHYRGDFLDGEPVGDWHLEMRDYLQRVYIDALVALGDAHTSEQRYAKAADAYRRVLARDELHEDALRSLMRALAHDGERTPAMRAYQRFAERMRRELDANPDRGTSALFERLQAGDSI